MRKWFFKTIGKYYGSLPRKTTGMKVGRDTRKELVKKKRRRSVVERENAILESIASRVKYWNRSATLLPSAPYIFPFVVAFYKC